MRAVCRANCASALPPPLLLLSVSPLSAGSPQSKKRNIQLKILQTLPLLLTPEFFTNDEEMLAQVTGGARGNGTRGEGRGGTRGEASKGKAGTAGTGGDGTGYEGTRGGGETGGETDRGGGMLRTAVCPVLEIGL